MKFLSELNRRNVVRVSVAYVVAAWVIVQVADLVLENIGAPQWVMQTLLFILAIGFFVSAIIAWAGLHTEAIEELKLNFASPGGDRFLLIDTLPDFDVLKDEPGYIELKTAAWERLTL